MAAAAKVPDGGHGITSLDGEEVVPATADVVTAEAVAPHAAAAEPRAEAEEEEGEGGDDSTEGATATRAAFAAAAGACTGELVTTTLFYPIELVKTRLQAAVQCNEGSFAYRGLGDGLYSVFREEGLQGLFAGLPSVALRAVASEFATVFFGEFLLGRYRLRGGQSSGALAVPLRTLGGCASILLTLPLETVATRVTTARKPISMAAAARQLHREGGLASFWRGLLISFVLCLNPALMLTTVDKLRSMLLALRQCRPGAGSKQLADKTPPTSSSAAGTATVAVVGRGNGAAADAAAGHTSLNGGAAEPQRCSKQHPRPEEQLSWAEAFFVGAFAKLLTMSAVYPLVRGKVLLQAHDTGGAGLLQVLAKTRHKEGLRGLYRGFGAQLSKSLLSASLKYAVKERTEQQWMRLLDASAAPASPA